MRCFLIRKSAQPLCTPFCPCFVYLFSATIFLTDLPTFEKKNPHCRSYHPIIFRGLKSLTLSDPQQRTLLRCAAGGISIYCPHTSLDATPGGINDWLSACISSSEAPKFSSPGALSGSWSPITPTKDGRYPGAGMGRLVRLPQSCSFNDLVDRVKRNLKLPTGT